MTPRPAETPSSSTSTSTSASRTIPPATAHSGGPTFLEPTHTIHSDPSSGHRDQDLAWSRSSTPNSSSSLTQPQPKSILQQSAPASVPVAASTGGHMGGSGKSEAETDGMGREGAEGSSQLAGKTLEPEAATQASKQAGGEEMGRRGSEGRSVRVVDNPEVGHTAIHEKVDCREKQEKSMKSGKSAGLTLPARAAKCLESAEIQMKFIGLYTNEYHAETNPDGLISLGVAENHLMDDIIMPKFKSAVAESFATTDLGYGDGIASRRLKTALGRYFDDYFAPRVPVEQDHLIVGNGCSAVFDQMAHVMCEPGDAVLIPQPYYVAYTADFSLRADARVEPVFVGHMDDGCEPDMIKGLERKVEELAKEGVRSRMLVFTNPNNPLGRTYPKETILAVAKFAQERDMYLIVNEIYARSVYDNEDWPAAPEFVSALSIDFEKEVPGFEMARLSVVYGMSKDFCANGLRVGVLVIQHNPELYMALLGIGFFGKISSLSDAVWSNILTDRQWLESFLGENKRRLGEAAKSTREWFTARGVEVSRSNGGNFMLVNLGKRLGKDTEEGELEISRILSEAGVFLATGKNFKQTMPGWFRVTFCAEPRKLHVALERIERVLGLSPDLA